MDGEKLFYSPIVRKHNKLISYLRISQPDHFMHHKSHIVKKRSNSIQGQEYCEGWEINGNLNGTKKNPKWSLLCYQVTYLAPKARQLM
eukprot:6445668-Ditylum_brightwellii.AAC.1